MWGRNVDTSMPAGVYTRINNEVMICVELLKGWKCTYCKAIILQEKVWNWLLVQACVWINHPLHSSISSLFFSLSYYVFLYADTILQQRSSGWSSRDFLHHDYVRHLLPLGSYRRYSSGCTVGAVLVFTSSIWSWIGQGKMGTLMASFPRYWKHRKITEIEYKLKIAENSIFATQNKKTYPRKSVFLEYLK